MVDRVVLDALQQPRDVRHLERRDAPGCEQCLHPGGEVVDVGDLGQDVVAHDQIGPAAVRDQPLGEIVSEELGQGRHAAVDRRLGDVRGRLDPEHRDALRQEMLQEIAVVRGELDHEALGAETLTLDHRLDVAPCMLDPGRRVGGEVGVLGEELRRRDELADLEQPALLAGAHVERVERLALLECVRPHHSLTEWRHPEIDHAELERRATETTRRRARNRGAEALARIEDSHRLDAATMSQK